VILAEAEAPALPLMTGLVSTGGSVVILAEAEAPALLGVHRGHPDHVPVVILAEAEAPALLMTGVVDDVNRAL
jgi:hypothetical protein